ncbi:MAG: hypothetical protein EZS28_041183 [Streblomastix strix]|uniref:Uncharacterized protein n=1 Tax=Streblomastix strix TaxID=222440 RepID=A0A5J4U008_9EUKA|nr:MAG: hypothetical protein EZS28_041183 [Streblomastix strix]
MVQSYNNSSVVCAGGGVRSIADIQSASYSKSEDDALLLVKADKSTTYTKGEDDALLLLKADKSTTYTKTEDDALLLLKADKTQLIESYTKGETNNLLNNKTDIGVSYTKGEDNALLLLKANQSTTYTKTETDYLISQVDVGDVDLTDYYNKTKTDELLSEKADTTELSNYMTLGTSQTINANKKFNNACRFVSSIDGMSTLTGSAFVKSGADDTVVLLGAGGTKPISEFTTTIDDSNYVKKDGDVQDIQGILRKTTLDQPYPEPTDDDYVTLGAVKSEFVSSIYSGSINGNLTANQFIKSGKDDTSVLLAGGGDALISSFGGFEDLTSTVTDKTSQLNFNTLQYYKIGRQYFFYTQAYAKSEITVGGALNINICQIPNTYVPSGFIFSLQHSDTFSQTYYAVYSNETQKLILYLNSNNWPYYKKLGISAFWIV